MPDPLRRGMTRPPPPPLAHLPIAPIGIDCQDTERTESRGNQGAVTPTSNRSTQRYQHARSRVRYFFARTENVMTTKRGSDVADRHGSFVAFNRRGSLAPTLWRPPAGWQHLTTMPSLWLKDCRVDKAKFPRTTDLPAPCACVIAPRKRKSAKKSSTVSHKLEVQLTRTHFPPTCT